MVYARMSNFFFVTIHYYRTSDILQKSSSYIIVQQAKCSTDNPDTESDVYVDVSNGDPVHYECFQLKSLTEGGKSMVMCNKLATDSDSVDKLVENKAYPKDQNDDSEDVVENIYDTIPGEFYQD